MSVQDLNSTLGVQCCLTSDIIILNLSPWCHTRMDAHHQSLVFSSAANQRRKPPQLTNPSWESIATAGPSNELEVWMKESFIGLIVSVSPSPHILQWKCEVTACDSIFWSRVTMLQRLIKTFSFDLTGIMSVITQVMTHNDRVHHRNLLWWMFWKCHQSLLEMTSVACSWHSCNYCKKSGII